MWRDEVPEDEFDLEDDSGDEEIAKPLLQYGFLVVVDGA